MDFCIDSMRETYSAFKDAAGCHSPPRFSRSLNRSTSLTNSAGSQQPRESNSLAPVFGHKSELQEQLERL